MKAFLLSLLLAGLSSDDFQKREGASLALWCCGQCAYLEPIERAMAHEDVEVSRRGQEALRSVLEDWKGPFRHLNDVAVPAPLRPLWQQEMGRASLLDSGLQTEYRETPMTWPEYQRRRDELWRNASHRLLAGALRQGWPPALLVGSLRDDTPPSSPPLTEDEYDQ